MQPYEISTKDFRNYTPCAGYWLADSGSPYADCFFDLTKPDEFPFELTNEEKWAFRSLLKDTHYLSVPIKCFNIGPGFRSSKIEPLLEFVRRKAQDNLDINKLPVPVSSFTRSEITDPRLLQKRLFFLHIAKKVVAGLETYSSAAAKYGIDKVNIKIWVSMYLSYGEKIFYLRDARLTPQEEAAIVKKHLDNGDSVVFTCTDNFIFSSNRFRNIFRRHRPSS